MGQKEKPLVETGLVSYSIGFDDADVNQSIFERVHHKFRGYKALFRQMAPMLAGGLGENIRSDKGKSAAKYKRRKAREGFGNKSLIRKKNLYNEVAKLKGVVRITKDSLRVGTNLKYAYVLENEYSRFMFIDEKTKHQIIDLFNKEIGRRVNKTQKEIDRVGVNG